MSANEENIQGQDANTPSVSPGNYSPVSVYMNGETLGAIFLGILSGILLVGWMRAEARYRALLMKRELTDERKHSLDT